MPQTFALLLLFPLWPSLSFSLSLPSEEVKHQIVHTNAEASFQTTAAVSPQFRGIYAKVEAHFSKFKDNGDVKERQHGGNQ